MGKHLGHMFCLLIDLMEEGMVGGEVDGETPGAYAVFADVANAYDQVWRDGLYLTLYSIWGSGVPCGT